ncbi:V-type ATP synthase subunit A, partial [bacterium]|nr:V-type ATP synthase subunit A [bacterium]
VTGIIGDIFPGKRKVEDIFCTIELDHDDPLEIRGFHKWPVRKKRPVNERLSMNEPFFTGQRVLDFLFPIPRGGVAAVPGGFGAGKTVLQHSIAKWSNADIIIYVGCGERGNEIAQILEEFPTLKDPRSGRSLMERTIIIANTSNMPVTARESSIYTGITMAEYYRDMGYNVTILADSTSRWAEALRELSSRLEEIPAEEGYPAYLASRLAEYYERAGSFKTLSGKTGSITAIGAVSPQGADFSEPVTQHTKRFVRSFWALDKSLASAKHFPAVSWKISYSEYGEEVVDWWKLNANVDWNSMRTTLAEILQDADKLENIIKIVGFESLPDREKLTVLSSNLIKKGFLQQNSYD